MLYTRFVLGRQVYMSLGACMAGMSRKRWVELWHPTWSEVWHHASQIARPGVRGAEIEFNSVTYNRWHLRYSFFFHLICSMGKIIPLTSQGCCKDRMSSHTFKIMIGTWSQDNEYWPLLFLHWYGLPPGCYGPLLHHRHQPEPEHYSPGQLQRPP